jgi:hypothetical protein
MPPSDALKPLWAKQESVEVGAEPAFAFRYLASIENMAADPGIERVEADGLSRDRPGMHGKTHLVGGGSIDWVVADAEADRQMVIDLMLPDACVRFELRFEPREGGGTIFTQRVSLFGPNAADHLRGAEAGFATSLRDGMLAVRDRIDAAAAER